MRSTSVAGRCAMEAGQGTGPRRGRLRSTQRGSEADRRRLARVYRTRAACGRWVRSNQKAPVLRGGGRRLSNLRHRRETASRGCHSATEPRPRVDGLRHASGCCGKPAAGPDEIATRRCRGAPRVVSGVIASKDSLLTLVADGIRRAMTRLTEPNFRSAAFARQPERPRPGRCERRPRGRLAPVRGRSEIPGHRARA